MSEFEKLEKYLRDNNIPYERIDNYPVMPPIPLLQKYGLSTEFHQLCVPSRNKCDFDVICHKGSYGYEEGLLEMMGLLTEKEKEEDRVVGWLTADDVIERIETMYER